MVYFKYNFPFLNLKIKKEKYKEITMNEKDRKKIDLKKYFFFSSDNLMKFDEI